MHGWGKNNGIRFGLKAAETKSHDAGFWNLISGLTTEFGLVRMRVTVKAFTEMSSQPCEEWSFCRVLYYALGHSLM